MNLRKCKYPEIEELGGFKNVNEGHSSWTVEINRESSNQMKLGK